jgi:deoxyribodipyrimidine photo-lyase
MAVVLLFHRDLRLVDHTGLRTAAALSRTHDARVLPLFVFTPEQVSAENKLRSMNSIQFMLKSLEELEDAVRGDGGRMLFAYGQTDRVLQNLHRRLEGGIKAVVETRDYTPYAKEREAKVAAVVAGLGAEHHLVEDSYLLPPGSVKTGAGNTFQKFTPFYETVRRKAVPRPLPKPPVRWFGGLKGGDRGLKGQRRSGATRRASRGLAFPGEVSLALMTRRLVPHPNPHIAVQGGRKEGLRLMHAIPRNYAEIHDVPAERTSILSAHNHYGTVSIREVYHKGNALGLTAFVRQLWWRDFYGHIMADFETLYKTHPYQFQKEPPRPLSPRQKEDLKNWCLGTTGVPLVDAGIKELLTTGYMHNRVRLAVASWLVKDRKVHWRLGERFFAQHLVDYDATQNMMNWIWVASVLPFASAPFRKVDPYRTAERFNAQGTYVKRWLD